MEEELLIDEVLEFKIQEDEIGWEETTGNYDIVAGCAPNCKPECKPGCRPDCGPHNRPK